MIVTYLMRFSIVYVQKKIITTKLVYFFLKFGLIKPLKHCFLLTVNKDSTDFLYFGNYYMLNQLQMQKS